MTTEARKNDLLAAIPSESARTAARSLLDGLLADAARTARERLLRRALHDLLTASEKEIERWREYSSRANTSRSLWIARDSILTILAALDHLTARVAFLQEGVRPVRGRLPGRLAGMLRRHPDGHHERSPVRGRPDVGSHEGDRGPGQVGAPAMTPVPDALSACSHALRLECPLRIMASLHQGQRRHYQGPRGVQCLPKESEPPAGWPPTALQAEMDRLSGHETTERLSCPDVPITEEDE